MEEKYYLKNIFVRRGGNCVVFGPEVSVLWDSYARYHATKHIPLPSFKTSLYPYDKPDHSYHYMLTHLAQYPIP